MKIMRSLFSCVGGSLIGIFLFYAISWSINNLRWWSFLSIPFILLLAFTLGWFIIFSPYVLEEYIRRKRRKLKE